MVRVREAFEPEVRVAPPHPSPSGLTEGEVQDFSNSPPEAASPSIDPYFGEEVSYVFRSSSN
jgi:hypothetical protein